MAASKLALKILGLAGLLALGAGCQAPPPRIPLSEPKDPAVLAAEALEAADYATAARLYRVALEKKPQSFPLHYGLAVAASNLDAREEAIREFGWVVTRGMPGSPEVEAARRWLISAGGTPAPADGFTATRKSRKPRDG